mmetsp:Transcript_20722/g.33011  ORF Transcript_20722/g.33011 Transcript_20722/m.33011 type:complete len:473 (-) Transcript_20722:8-1426(-)
MYTRVRRMSSTLALVASLIATTRSCSPILPDLGTVYVSNVQLLDVANYPDSVLLTIYRTTDAFGSTYGPWCKIMNVNDGTVGDTVDCTQYASLTRTYDTAVADTSQASCVDNCDGATATCAVTRDNTLYTITDVPYDSSTIATSCDPTVGGIATIFTIESESTMYIVFSSNTVGVQFDSTSSAGYNLLSVDIQGDVTYLTPAGFSDATTVSFYTDTAILRHSVPCCICYSYVLKTYAVDQDATGTYDQVLTLTSVSNEGSVDSTKQKVFRWNAAFYGDTVLVYDLSTGTSNSFQPDLCGQQSQCSVSPCSTSSCPYNPTAQCADDYCGGCYARWFCGATEITDMCQSIVVSTEVCIPTTTTEPPTAEPTTTTAEPTTTEPTTTAPTTADPTTSEPTTAEPTVIAPTTTSPTTSAPTTSSPTTVSPTTAELTTAEPTEDPIFDIVATDPNDSVSLKTSIAIAMVLLIALFLSF